ncbi:MAG: efflux RND transporter periplasmic adaptor subunit [Kiritimatiellia bacterium]
MKRNNPTATITLWSAVTISILLIALLAILPARKPVDIDDTAAPDLVRVTTVQPRNLIQTIELPGRVLPNRSLMLAAEIAGVITAILVDKGDSVKQGDVLARIDHRNWEAQLRQAAIAARDATRDLERWQRMQTEGAVSQSDFEAVQRRQQLAAITHELAQIQVDKSYLRAPTNGIIDDQLLEAGAFINEGQALFRFIERDPMKVVFHIPERDVALIRPEQRLAVRATALEQPAPFYGKLSHLGNETTPPAFSYPAELTIESAPAYVRPGMIVNVEIERAILENAIAVPLPAVIPRRGEHVVFVYRDGIAERTVVWINTMLNGEVVIKSGLEPGDRVIVNGHRTLQDGARVEIEMDQE